MTSLISNKATGLTCKQNTTSQPASGVKVEISGIADIREKYGMITSSFSVTESENMAVLQTIGGDTFIYSTNSSPVQISLKGVIGYIGDNEIGNFPKFYNDYKVSNGGKLLKITIDKTSYKGVFTGYTRTRESTPSELDSCSIQLIAVRI